MDQDQIYNYLLKILPENQIKINEPMKNHTSFKVGGIADFYIVAKEVEQIKKVIELAQNNNIPLTIIGNGSNILVSDKGIRGIVIKIEIKQFEIKRKKEKAIITVGAGEPLGKIAYSLANEGIAGFEFAGGIPGYIGGAIRMNAGAYGGEMKDCVKSVVYLTLDGNLKEFSNKECNFSYRHSIFCNKKLIVIKAILEFSYGNKEEILKKMEEYAEARKEKQPLQYPSAGSTFKRGTDFITAKLIDECGLKGYAIGGAQVSNLHAGFIVNIGNATAKDIISVINYVKNTVFEKTGKKIELEIEILGET